MDKLKRARLIYNPTSGREAIELDLAKIMQVYEEAGYETSAFATTTKENSAQNEAERAAKAGFDLIIAAGGDGTISQVINGISPLKNRPMMAILPAGTTNDYARALNIPREDLIEAAQVINQKQTIKMDIGQANQKYFMNIAALGSLTEITYTVSRLLKKAIGYLAYITQGAEAITKIKNVPVRIEHDQGVFEDQVSLIFLALTNSIGGFEKIVPDAKLDDGNFSLLIVRKANVAELIQLATKALSGRHIGDRLIEYVKTKKAVITPLTDDEMKINLDGDLGGITPVTFVNLKQHIEFVTNLSKEGRRVSTASDDRMMNAEKKLIEQVNKKIK